MASPTPTPTPTPEIVQRIHDRYLIEIVEELGLCPFARHSREQGRVHRPLFWPGAAPWAPAEAASQLLDVITAHDDAEIVLLTFVDLAGQFEQVKVFETFVTQAREAYDKLGGPVFFMVGFHRNSGADGPDEVTKDSLVPLIRRSPDPVIQCVNAEVLDRARRTAQEASRKRLLESVGGKDPVLRAMLERSIQPDSELSSDIAKHNFAEVGSGAGRAEFERRINDILRDRDASYGVA